MRIGQVAAVAGGAAAVWGAAKAARWSHHYGILAPGNMPKYALQFTSPAYDPVIGGKRMVFLGSSVTYGMAARGDSFVDYLEKTCGLFAIKEAVSGTTLVDEPFKGRPSYVARMKALDPSMKLDAFMCQLSTNDARQGKPLDGLSDSYDLEDFDRHTIAGALEYIICYVKSTWGCPLMFYTSQQFSNPTYPQVVDLLYQAQKKWGFAILDLWNDATFNAIEPCERALYMANDVHPTRAGYKIWWLPKFKTFLNEQFAS